MNFKTLQDMQRELDAVILKDVTLSDDEITKKLLVALTVEAAELMNEVKSFKYWSKKPASAREVILEELVDCWHFVLSLCNRFDIKVHEDAIKFYSSTKVVRDVELRYMTFLHTCSRTYKLLPMVAEEDYILYILKSLCQLTYTLDFTSQDIFEAYVKKNKINHERQQNGY